MEIPTNFQSPTQVRQFVENCLGENSPRTLHVFEIAKKVKESGQQLGLRTIDLNLAECAALLHDIGYWQPIAFTGFHPFDGALFLESRGEDTLAKLIIGHSCSPEEAELGGYPGVTPSDSLLAKLLTYWDMQVKQGGEVVSYAERYNDIILRYGPETVVGQANRKARPRIEKLMEEIDSLLKK